MLIPLLKTILVMSLGLLFLSLAILFIWGICVSVTSDDSGKALDDMSHNETVLLIAFPLLALWRLWEFFTIDMPTFWHLVEHPKVWRRFQQRKRFQKKEKVEEV